jgi:peptide/nickel transport system permease protein
MAQTGEASPVTSLTLPHSFPATTRVWQTVRQNPLGAVAALFLVGLVLVAITAPAIAPYPYDQTNVTRRLQGPSAAHLLGTDSLGRDVLSRIIYGARISVGLSSGAVALAALVAVTVGLLCGYRGGWFDALTQRAVDTLMSFPGIILVISLTAFLGRGIPQLMVAIAISLLGGAIRISRSATIQARAQAYVEAAVSTGASTPRILLRHILPNISAPLMVISTVQLGFAILIEATASFLGYGVRPPYPSWGSMLSGDARSYMQLQPLLSVWPGIAIFLTVYSLNMLGDTLRDVLDPRLRGRR